MKKKWTVSIDKLDNKLITSLVLQIQAAEKAEKKGA